MHFRWTCYWGSSKVQFFIECCGFKCTSSHLIHTHLRPFFSAKWPIETTSAIVICSSFLFFFYLLLLLFVSFLPLQQLLFRCQWSISSLRFIIPSTFPFLSAVLLFTKKKKIKKNSLVKLSRGIETDIKEDICICIYRKKGTNWTIIATGHGRRISLLLFWYYSLGPYVSCFTLVCFGYWTTLTYIHLDQGWYGSVNRCLNLHKVWFKREK